jgi:hypothetical protein
LNYHLFHEKPFGENQQCLYFGHSFHLLSKKEVCNFSRCICLKEAPCVFTILLTVHYFVETRNCIPFWSPQCLIFETENSAFFPRGSFA